MENGMEDAYTCPSFNSYSSNKLVEIAAEKSDDEGDSEFSFTEFSADEFVYEYDGQFGPIFPVFNRDLLLTDDSRLESSIRVPLGKLFIGDNSPSGSADQLDNIPAGSYCVWRPEVSPSRCKKSKSTGSASKRWRFLNLLRRSNSDGLVFLTPRNSEDKSPRKLKEKGGSGRAVVARSAHEALYVRNRAINEVDKKKSYLPYRQDLVGFFLNANAFPHL